ncbi:MAG: DUF916 and DUF3324 domain-containing protein [Actinomycetia bacterium]|nr:DUF916 and DUF3324 domain-containing protein [Actinomycetes bacterium]
MRAEIPENQIDRKQSYFDIHMVPGQQQDLKVDVTNESDRPIIVNAAAVSASTNENGVIDYRTPDIADETLKIPFSDVSYIRQPTLTVPAGGVATVVVSITMPDKRFDGAVLGGICITKQSQDAPAASEPDDQGVTIQNVYSYVIGVKLTETDVLVQPDFEYFDIQPDLVHYHPALVHYLRNKEAAIAKDLHVKIEVFRTQDDSILSSATKKINMAPNSSIPLGIVLPEGRLDPGNYRSVMDLEMDGSTWHFERLFNIDAGEASRLNTQADVVSYVEMPWWLPLMITGLILAALLCLLLLLLLLKLRRREKDKDEQGSLLIRTEKKKD